MKSLEAIVSYIYGKAREENMPIGVTRMMKILYLLDVEYYREKREKATPLKWIFYKFGPYSFELEGQLEKMGFDVEEKVLEDGKVFKKLEREEWAYQKPELASEIQIMLDRVLRQWLIEDLNKLLDHVYFDTEPMEKAKRMEELDFSLIEPKIAERLARIELNKQKIKDLRKRLEDRVREVKKEKRKLIFDEHFLKALKIWDEEILADASNLRGTCRIDLGNMKEKEDDAKGD